MRNRAVNVFFDESRSRRRLETAWQVDRHPAGRLAWLFVLLALPLLAIVARLAQLQCWLVDDYVASYSATTQGLESVPSVDGRIYAGDGRVLAEDVERYNISVHYRWLQDPPDERWLLQQAFSKLRRAERRDRTRVAAEKRRVVAVRDRMWKRLAELSGTPPDRLSARRAAIQNRVEQIAELVARRHADTADSTAGIDERPAPDNLRRRLWKVVVDALTTPPRREEREPIVVREELDYHAIVEDVPLAVRAEIEAYPRRYPGVRVGSTSRRVYHESGLAPHVIGARVPLSADDLARRRGGGKSPPESGDPLDYRAGDRIGRTGVEASYDAYLHGLRGLRRLTRNRYGEIVGEELIRAPRPGGNLELTLNMPVERKMERLLDEILAGKRPPHPLSAADDSQVPSGGCVVALDVHSGAVLVAAGGPRFDFGTAGVPDAAAWKRSTDDPRHPLFHRAIQMALPPGSVFKVVSAVALLESRRIDPDVRYECRGYLEHPDRFRCLVYAQQKIGHEPVDLSDALCRSCNVYFFHSAGIIGPQPIVDWARRLGIGRPTGIDLPFEQSGNLPDPELQAGTGSRKMAQGPWHVADTRALAIGQSSLAVTPLQIARMMAAVANNGYLVTPFVARKAGPQTADDEASAQSTPFSRRQPVPGLTEGTLARIRSALEKTVSDPLGTAFKTVRTKEISIAGKTGTAQVGGGKPDHAWFAGYAPADKPRIAFAVVLEHAGSGSKAAGPVARQLVEAFLADGVLEPSRVTMRE